MKSKQPFYCCIPLEFIQPWDLEEALHRVVEHKLGNMVMIQPVGHVGNSDAERDRWKRAFPSAAAKIDALPRFPERPEHGMCIYIDLPFEFRLDLLEKTRALGLQAFVWTARLELTEEQRCRLEPLAQGCVFTEMFMGENLSILGHAVPLEKIKQLDATPVLMPVSGQGSASAGPDPNRKSIFDAPESLDFQKLHDWFVARFRKHGLKLRETWDGPLTAIEASPQVRLAMEAGGDIPIFELVPSEPLAGVASTRGAAKAYGKDTWGVHAAMGYYRPPADMWMPERLRIGYDLFYIGGANFFSEPNVALCNWGSCTAFFTIRANPPIRWGEKECLPFEDPICVRGREVLSEHYRFTQFHDRPAAGPRVPMGYLLGHLDAWIGGHGGERMWMVDQPGFVAKDAINTWRHFDRAFDAEQWYVPPRKYYWQADPAKPLYHGTPPCGQVDLVPIEAPAEVLGTYGTLVMLGWNTMTEANYAKLKGFVAAGGTLFLSVPHLSTRTRTDRPQEFIRGGDVRDLCGVKILGEGDAVEEIYFEHAAQNPKHVFPQGVLYLEEAKLAKVELHGARPLVNPRGKPERPAFFEHRVGKGVVYLLNTWDYPGERLDAFVTDVLRTLAESEQRDIAVEGRDVFYAVYDEAAPSGEPHAVVYLSSHDVYGQPAYPRMTVRGSKVPLRVDGREMRIAWVFDGLVVSPFDKFVKLTDATRDAGGWTVMLESELIQPGAETDAPRRLQLEGLDTEVRRVSLDGKTLIPQRTVEGECVVASPLTGRQTLRIETSSVAKPSSVREIAAKT